jgi:hypothetical protein
LLFVVLAAFARLHADQVEMQNGDRYFGKVLSLTNDTLLFRSDLLGTVRLPREKVARVGFGAAPLTNVTAMPALAGHEPGSPAQTATNSSADFALKLRQLGTNSFLMRQVQSQFLSDAGPEAKDKFNELVGGLLSGKLTVSDIRAEAQSAAERLRAARKDLGDDAGWMIDSYLAILDHFVKETAPPPGSSPSAATAPKSTKPETAAEQE